MVMMLSRRSAGLGVRVTRKGRFGTSGSGSAGIPLSLLLFGHAGIDAEDVPVVPVEVAEAAPVDETLVVRLIGGQAAGRQRSVGELVDPLPALDLQLHDHLAHGSGVWGLPLGNGLEV